MRLKRELFKILIEKGSMQPIPSVVISVADINAAVKNINDAGGNVLVEPMDISRIGKYVSFND